MIKPIPSVCPPVAAVVGIDGTGGLRIRLQLRHSSPYRAACPSRTVLLATVMALVLRVVMMVVVVVPA